MNIIHSNISEINLQVKENTWYFINEKDLCYFSKGTYYSLCEKENTFIEQSEDYYKRDVKVEVKVDIEYKIPRKYKSIDKKVTRQYDEGYTPQLMNISGIYMGISMVTKSKYLFIIYAGCDQVLMLDNQKNLNNTAIVTKQHLKDMYELYLLADEVDDYLSDKLFIRVSI